MSNEEDARHEADVKARKQRNIVLALRLSWFLGGSLAAGGTMEGIHLAKKYGGMGATVLSHDSPVEIAGGSVHLCTIDAKIPASTSTHQDWEITGLADTDWDKITTENVSRFPDLSAISNNGDWEVRITDGVEHDAVTLLHSAGEKKIRVHTRDTGSSVSSDGYAILLPPDDHNCEQTHNCAPLEAVTIRTNGITKTGVCYNGTELGKCGVYIGALRPKGPYKCEEAK